MRHAHQTTPDADRFVAAVEAHTKDLKAFSVGASERCDSCGPFADEGFFSWRGCDSCGSTLGGNRYPAHYIEDGEILHCDVCEDCLFFHANGEEPEEWRQSPRE